MNPWVRLERELQRWESAGETAAMWWRDDDANAGHDNLDRLLRMCRRYRIPLTLAVIPCGVDHNLSGIVRETPVTIVQHGFRHRNHSPAGEKKQELGPHRPIPAILGELESGCALLRNLFTDDFMPCLVPPWNRLAAGLLPHLAKLGFRTLSTFGPREAAEPVAGLRQINTHVDILNTRAGPGFRGLDETLELLIRHLEAKRKGVADRQEWSGLLTHHLVHDEECWDFCDELFSRLTNRPGVRWLPLGHHLD